MSARANSWRATRNQLLGLVTGLPARRKVVAGELIMKCENSQIQRPAGRVLLEFTLKAAAPLTQSHLCSSDAAMADAVGEPQRGERPIVQNKFLEVRRRQ